MLRLAVNAVIGFPDAPPKLAISLSLAVSSFALCYGLHAIEPYLTNEAAAG